MAGGDTRRLARPPSRLSRHSPLRPGPPYLFAASPRRAGPIGRTSTTARSGPRRPLPNTLRRRRRRRGRAGGSAGPCIATRTARRPAGRLPPVIHPGSRRARSGGRARGSTGGAAALSGDAARRKAEARRQRRLTLAGTARPTAAAPLGAYLPGSAPTNGPTGWRPVRIPGHVPVLFALTVRCDGQPGPGAAGRRIAYSIAGKA